MLRNVPFHNTAWAAFDSVWQDRLPGICEQLFGMVVVRTSVKYVADLFLKSSCSASVTILLDYTFGIFVFGISLLGNHYVSVLRSSIILYSVLTASLDRTCFRLQKFGN